MTGHREHRHFQLDLADYATGRLDPGRARAVGEHVRGCPRCARWLEGVGRLSEVLGREGEDLLSPHPDPRALREIAERGGRPGDPDLERHLASCAVCSLQVEGWRRRLAGESGAGAVSRGRSPRPAVLLALAAGLLVGWGLAAVGLGRPAAPAAPPQEAPARPGPGGGAEGRIVARFPDGSLPLIHLMALRGTVESRTFEVGAGAPFISTLVSASIPPEVPDGEMLRAVIERKGGRAVWTSRPEPAHRLRRRLERLEVLSYVVPGAALAPGRYELALRGAGPEGERTLVRIPFTIARPDPAGAP